MYPHLYFAAILVVSLELFFIGMLVSYFQKKVIIADLIGLIMSCVGAFVFLYLGQWVGKRAINWLNESSGWYAATVMFILGLKMFYDRIKISKTKQLINPLESKGLFVLTILLGINIFFIGLACGLLNTTVKFHYFSLAILLILLFAGYVMGFKSKKLFSRRFEFLSGILYIIIAIIIATNI